MNRRKLVGVLAILGGLICCAPGFAQEISTYAGGGAFVSAPSQSIAVPSPRATTVAMDGSVYYIAGESVYHLDAVGDTATLVAGNGTNGYSGDGGPATAAQLSNPLSVAVDAIGNLFIADTGNSVIRRVDATSGTMSTVAGTGRYGYSGDGGPATSAQMSYPNSIAIDGAGNLYLADANNRVIRCVNGASGTISTVAGNGTFGFSGDGGAATNARLSTVYAVGVDAEGDLYIADTTNDVVRRVDAASGIITTIAGTPHSAGYSGDGGPATGAQLSNVYGLAVDAAGNLFIADTVNQVVRRVDAASGTVVTVAGVPHSSGYSGDNGPARGAQFYYPYGVAVDAASNLYIADEGNNRLRRVDGATSTITTSAGNGTHGFGGDGGPAVSAQLYDPQGIAVDGAGNLFVADHANDVIRRVDAASGTITTVAGTGAPGYSGDGGPATAAAFAFPSGVALDPAGDLYVADTGNNVIRRVDGTSGIITTVAGNGIHGGAGDGGPATAAQLSYPNGIALDAAGDLYIADTYNQVIRRVDAVSGVISTIAGTGGYGYSGDGGPAVAAQLFSPSGIAVDVAGNIYVADEGNDAVRRIDAVSAVITTVAGNGTDGYSGDGGPATGAELSVVTGVATDAIGNLYIADEGNSVIRQVDVASGTIATLAGNGTYGFSGDGGPATSAALAGPYGVAVNAGATLYFSDLDNQRIRSITLVDANPPAIGPVITGKLGKNGWYTNNVTVNWAVQDALGPILSETGCNTTVISVDTVGVPLTCSATSAGGSATKTVTIARDATPPTVAITTPASGVRYALGSSVIAAYTCADLLSGAATCVGTSPSGAALNTATAGTFTFTVTATDVAGNAASKHVTYTVFAGIPTYTLAPSPLAFGNQTLANPAVGAVTLTNTGAAVLPITSIGLGGGNASQFTETNTCAPSVPAGGTCAISVVFTPTTAGAKTSTLTVTAGGGARTASVRVNGTGVASAFTVSPAALAFGNQTVGAPGVAQAVTITNTGSGPLPIAAVALVNTRALQFSELNGCPAALATGSSCAISVTFLPTSVGSKTNTLRIAVHGGAASQSVTLSGTGTKSKHASIATSATGPRS